MEATSSPGLGRDKDITELQDPSENACGNQMALLRSLRGGAANPRSLSELRKGEAASFGHLAAESSGALPLLQLPTSKESHIGTPWSTGKDAFLSLGRQADECQTPHERISSRLGMFQVTEATV